MSPQAENRLETLIGELREMVAACMQCGTCSASCPNVQSMDLPPRQLWRLLLLGLDKEALDGRNFWYCSSCYTCTLRCPRGLPLTEVMGGLKRLASLPENSRQRRNSAFYRAFMDNIRTWGRIQEADLMLHYFISMRDPALPLGFTPLGLKMLRKGKVHPPDSTQKGRLRAMFDKAAELEAGS